MSEANNVQNTQPDGNEAAGQNVGAGNNASGVDLLNDNVGDEKQGLISRMCCSSRAKDDSVALQTIHDEENPK